MNPSDYAAPEDEGSTIDPQFSPPLTFQGKELWPYTRGTHTYYKQTFEEEDTTEFRDLAFVFIHLKRDGKSVYQDVMSIQPLLMNGGNLRAAMGEWLDELSGGDFGKGDAVCAEAKRIRRDALELVRKTEVDVSDAEASEDNKKKSVGTPPAKMTISSGSLLPSSDTAAASPTGN